MFAISYLGSGDAPAYSPPFLIGVALSLTGGYLFIRHSRLDPNAFIPFDLLRGSGFGIVNVVNLLLGAGALGFGALVPPLRRGAISEQHPFGRYVAHGQGRRMICVAGLAVFALRRTGYRAPLVAGSVVVAVGLVMMALTPIGNVSHFAWLAIAAGITGLGMGISVPASNNASLQMAPTQVSAISGLRGMFRQSGSILAVSITTAVLARSADPGVMLGHVFLVFAGIVLITIPLIFRIPDHRGRW